MDTETDKTEAEIIAESVKELESVIHTRGYELILKEKWLYIILAIMRDDDLARLRPYVLENESVLFQVFQMGASSVLLDELYEKHKTKAKT
jgi:hypothetical protein